MQAMLSHYRVLEEIGKGGMGVVYRAHDEGTLDRDVAVKVLPADALADEGARRRFRKEATALSKLNHPNIATVFDFDSDNGTDFLVEELIPGLSLSEMLVSGPLPEREIINLGSQLCEGLAAAHEQGVIHRDLKPANIRVTPDARLKILDFGLAKVLRTAAAGSDTDATASLTETQTVSGTFPYMAPEQLLNEKLDQRTDIWAAGCVLYEMATGRRPFLGYGPALIDAILHQQPPAPSTLNSKVAPGLDAIILKCLEKDPTLRYTSGRDIFVDLHRLGTGRVTKALATRRRSATFKAAMAVLAIVIVAAGGWAFHRWNRRSATQTPAAKARNIKPEARELYLKGDHLLRYGSKAKAGELFSQAVSIDPQYAEAWAGLANAYLMQPHYEGVPPMTVFPKAVEAVNKALAIDSTVSEGHSALGKIKAQYEYDWQGAEEEFRRALQLNPKDRHAHLWYGLIVLIGHGRFDDGLAELKRGYDPASSDNVPYRSFLAMGFYYAGRYDDAVRYLQEALDLDPNFELAHESLGIAYSAQGKHQEAIAELKRAEALYALRSVDVFGQGARTIAALGYVYGSAGKRKQALAMLDQLKKMSKKRYIESPFFAHVHVGLGNKEEAIWYLQRGYEERAGSMLGVKVAPCFKSLHSDPRFQELLRRMNLSQ